MTSGADPARIQAFITEWEVSGGAELPAQAAALSTVLGTLSAPADVSAIAGHFDGKRTKKRLEEVTRLLETLEALGRAVEREGGWVSSG